MNDPKGGVAKVTCPTFEAMGQIPAFHRTYFLFYVFSILLQWFTVNLTQFISTVLYYTGFSRRIFYRQSPITTSRQSHHYSTLFPVITTTSEHTNLYSVTFRRRIGGAQWQRLRWSTTDILRPNNTDTTTTPHFMKKVVVMDVVWCAPHRHHNFFHKVWCRCGLGEGCQLWAGRKRPGRMFTLIVLTVKHVIL